MKEKVTAAFAGLPPRDFSHSQEMIKEGHGVMSAYLEEHRRDPVRHWWTKPLSRTLEAWQRIRSRESKRLAA